MKALQNVTTQELEKELAKRKGGIGRPIVIDNNDWSAVIGRCVEYARWLDEEDESDDEDYTHHIFETAMEAVFGEAVWGFVNSRRC